MDIKITMSASPRVLAQALLILNDNLDKLDKPDPEAEAFIKGIGDTPAEKPAPAKPKSSPKTAKPAASETAAEPLPEWVTQDAPATKEENKKEESARITLEDIRKLVISKEGSAGKIKELLNHYKVKTIPDLDKSLFAEFYEKVKAL